LQASNAWRTALIAYLSFVAGCVLACAGVTGFGGHPSNLADALRGMQYVVGYAGGTAALTGLFPFLVCIRSGAKHPLLWATTGLIVGIPLMFIGVWTVEVIVERFRPVTGG